MRRWAAIIALAVLVALSIVRLVGNPQAERMQKAAAHAPRVMSMLRQDHRFSEVRAGEFSGNGGSFAVHGVVDSEDDLRDLKKLVQSTAPPVPVTWFVSVIPGATSQPAVP